MPIICTGYTQGDLERDINWVRDKCAGEFDVLLEPGENRFRSLRWDLNDMDPSDVSAGNWGIWAFRGKRYVLSLPLQKNGSVKKMLIFEQVRSDA